MAHIDTPQTQTANRRFIKRAMDVPLLTAEREQTLARSWRDERDERALHELTLAYVRLVIAMATRFRHYGLPVGDLIQEGNIGLMQAADRFDPERAVRFSTYAAWWIRSAMQEYVLRNWSIVRTGTTAAHKSLFFNLRRLKSRIRGESGTQLSADGRRQVAKQLRVPETDVEFMEGRLAASDRSLNAAFAEDGEGEWQDLLPDEREIPEDVVMSTHDGERRSHWIQQALEQLNDREQTIIRERRLQDEAVTLETLGRRLGISKERVRQIEHNALGKLKKALLHRHGDPVEAGLLER